MRLFLRAFIAIGALVAIASWAAAQEQQVYKAGDGVTLPVVTKSVRPNYTKEAMAARIEGSVGLEVMVKADGMVGDVRVSRSLDQKYGLDEQAVTAMKQWQFEPGKKDGKPVAVQVEVQMTFTLK